MKSPVASYMKSPVASYMKSPVASYMNGVAGVACCLLAVIGCRGLPTTPAKGSDEQVSSPKLVDLHVAVRPLPANKIEFEVHAKGDNLPRRWVVQKHWAGDEDTSSALSNIQGWCGDKSVALTTEDLETHLGWTFPAACADAKLRYTLVANPHGLTWGYEFDGVMTPHPMGVASPSPLVSAIAETALILPDCPDTTRVDVHVEFDLRETPGRAALEAVYSLGPNRQSTTLRAARHAYFLIGEFRSFHARAGNLTLEGRVSQGVTFDLAPMRFDLERLLGAQASLFADRTPEVLRLALVGMPTTTKHHGQSHGMSLTSSAIIWLDGSQPWGMFEKRLVAHEMFHLYNGQVIERSGKDTTWFSEGFTEYFTDQLLLRSRVWTAAEWLRSTNMQLNFYYNHKYISLPNVTPDKPWPHEAVSLPYLRGGLVAAYIDHTLRTSLEPGATGHSLDTFMRSLLLRARRGGKPLTSTDLLKLLDEQLANPTAAALVRSVIVDGKRLVLPKNTYGSCVQLNGMDSSTVLETVPGVELESCLQPRSP